VLYAGHLSACHALTSATWKSKSAAHLGHLHNGISEHSLRTVSKVGPDDARCCAADCVGRLELSRFCDYFGVGAAGAFSPDVSNFVLSVLVVEPSGVVTVVVFLTSAFLSQPMKGIAKPRIMQKAKNRFIV